jgi:hypothetical protein
MGEGNLFGAPMFNFLRNNNKEKTAEKIYNSIELQFQELGVRRTLISQHMQALISGSDTERNELVMLACRAHMFAVALLTVRLKKASCSDELVSKYSTQMMQHGSITEVMQLIVNKLPHTCRVPNAVAIAEMSSLLKAAHIFDVTLKNFGSDEAMDVWFIAVSGRYNDLAIS